MNLFAWIASCGLLGRNNYIIFDCVPCTNYCNRAREGEKGRERERVRAREGERGGWVEREREREREREE